MWKYYHGLVLEHFHQPKSFLCLFTVNPCSYSQVLGNHWCVFYFYNRPFLDISSDWNHNMQSFTSGSFPEHNVFDKQAFSSVQFSRSVVSDSLQPHESQHARPPCPSPTPRVHPNSCPLSRWCQPAISSSVVPFSFCPNPSQHQSLFQWINSSHEVTKVLEFQLQHQSFQWIPRTDLLENGLVASPCSPKY